MDARDKELLLEEFRDYLDRLDGSPPEADEAGADLCSLLTELAALRTELRNENRLFRGAMDELRDVQAWLKGNQASLEQSLERQAALVSGLRRDALRPLLLDILDLHDRLSAAAAALDSYRPVRGWFRIKSRPEDRRFIDSVRDGQAMTLRRLEELLARQGVRPMDVVGRPLDPYTMKAVELDRNPPPGAAAGTVTADLRRGFHWGEEVLRLAEVRATP